MTLHAYECACERKAHAQPDSLAVTGVWGAIALVANMPHAIRRSLQAGACGNDSAGEQMRTRTQDACAARFRTLVVGACIATCEQTKCVPWPTWYLATVAMPY